MKSRVEKVTIRNLHKSYRLNEIFIKKIVTKISRSLKVPMAPELEVIFLDDKAIKLLNKEYKRRDRPTDVLSFKIDRKEFGRAPSLGEICISLDTAFRNARIFKTTFENEVVLYIIHGILHLAGYKDKKGVDRLRMSKKEMDILNSLCEKEDLSRVLMPQ